MKKLYFLATALVLALSANAQQEQISIARQPIRFHAQPRHTHTGYQTLAIVGDTLLPPIDTASNSNGCDSVYYLYQSTRGGYVTGVNAQRDKEDLMKYSYPRTVVVKSVVALIGGVTVGAGNSDVRAVVYGHTSTGAPNTAVRFLSDPTAMSGIANRAANQFDFPSDSAVVGGVFYVGIVLPTGAGDTLAIYTTQTDGTGASPCTGDTSQSFAFQRISTNRFLDLNTRWGFPTNVEMYVWPLIQYDDAVSTTKLLSSLVTVHPVPASDFVAVTLPYNTKGATAWQLYGMDGKIASSATLSEAKMMVEVPRGNLQAGVYTLRMQTPAGPIAKRVTFN